MLAVAATKDRVLSSLAPERGFRIDISPGCRKYYHSERRFAEEQKGDAGACVYILTAWEWPRAPSQSCFMCNVKGECSGLCPTQRLKVSVRTAYLVQTIRCFFKSPQAWRG